MNYYKVQEITAEMTQNPRLTGEQTAQACDMAWFRKLSRSVEMVKVQCP
jgi:hypothetical protein